MTETNSPTGKIKEKLDIQMLENNTEISKDVNPLLKYQENQREIMYKGRSNINLEARDIEKIALMSDKDNQRSQERRQRLNSNRLNNENGNNENENNENGSNENNDSNGKKSNISRKKRYFTSIFTGDGLEKYKGDNYPKIYEEIKKKKEKAYIKCAYINNKNELVIQTDRNIDKIEIEKTWSPEAFENANLKNKITTRRFFCVARGVSKKIETQEFKKDERVCDVLRLLNKENNKTTSVRLEAKDEKTINEMKSSGIYIGYYRFRIEEWENRVIQCFKCQEFGHKSPDCKKTQKCAKCSGEHSAKNCLNLKKCVNCGDEHPSWSKKCNKLIERKQFINPRMDVINKEKEEKKAKYSEVLANNKTEVKKNENMTTKSPVINVESLIERMNALEKTLSELVESNIKKDKIIEELSNQLKQFHQVEQIQNLTKQNPAKTFNSSQTKSNINKKSKDVQPIQQKTLNSYVKPT